MKLLILICLLFFNKVQSKDVWDELSLDDVTELYKVKKDAVCPVDNIEYNKYECGETRWICKQSSTDFEPWEDSECIPTFCNDNNVWEKKLSEDEIYACSEHLCSEIHGGEWTAGSCGPRVFLTDMLPSIPIWTEFLPYTWNNFDNVKEQDGYRSAKNMLKLYSTAYEYCKVIFEEDTWAGFVYDGPFGRADIYRWFKDYVGPNPTMTFYIGTIEDWEVGGSVTLFGVQIGGAYQESRTVTTGLSIGWFGGENGRPVCAIDFNTDTGKGGGVSVGLDAAYFGASLGAGTGFGLVVGQSWDWWRGEDDFPGEYDFTVWDVSVGAEADASIGPVGVGASFDVGVYAGIVSFYPPGDRRYDIGGSYSIELALGVQLELNLGPATVSAGWGMDYGVSLELGLSKGIGTGITMEFRSVKNRIVHSVQAAEFADKYEITNAVSPTIVYEGINTHCQNPKDPNLLFWGAYYFTQITEYILFGGMYVYRRYQCSSITHCPLGQVYNISATYDGKRLWGPENEISTVWKCATNTVSDCCMKCGKGTYATLPSKGTVVEDTSRNINKGAKYLSYTDATTCRICEIGRYADVEGLSACKLCPAGRYNDYRARKRFSDCLQCSPGFFQNQLGQSKCKECRDRWQDEIGKSECKVCPAGKYMQSKEKITTKEKCTPCEAGLAGYRNKEHDRPGEGYLPELKNHQYHISKIEWYCGRCDEYADIEHKKRSSSKQTFIPAAPYWNPSLKYLVPHKMFKGRCMLGSTDLHLTRWQCESIQWIDKDYIKSLNFDAALKTKNIPINARKMLFDTYDPITKLFDMLNDPSLSTQLTKDMAKQNLHNYCNDIITYATNYPERFGRRYNGEICNSNCRFIKTAANDVLERSNNNPGATQTEYINKLRDLRSNTGDYLEGSVDFGCSFKQPIAGTTSSNRYSNGRAFCFSEPFNKRKNLHGCTQWCCRFNEKNCACPACKLTSRSNSTNNNALYKMLTDLPYIDNNNQVDKIKEAYKDTIQTFPTRCSNRYLNVDDCVTQGSFIIQEQTISDECHWGIDFDSDNAPVDGISGYCNENFGRSEGQCALGQSTWRSTILPVCADKSGRTYRWCVEPASTWGPRMVGPWERGHCADNSGRTYKQCLLGEANWAKSYECDDGSGRDQIQCALPASTWSGELHCQDGSGRNQKHCELPASTWEQPSLSDGGCADGSGRSEVQCVLPKANWIPNWSNDHRSSTHIISANSKTKCESITWKEGHPEDGIFIQDMTKLPDDTLTTDHIVGKVMPSDYTPLQYRTVTQMRDYISTQNPYLWRFYQPDTGKPQCKPCPVGQRVTKGGTQCIPINITQGLQMNEDMYYSSICPHDYQPSVSKTDCIACPSGKSSRGLTSTDKINNFQGNSYVVKSPCTCLSCLGQCYDSTGNPIDKNEQECLTGTCYDLNNLVNINENECRSGICYDSTGNPNGQNEQDCLYKGICVSGQVRGTHYTGITMGGYDKSRCLALSNKWHTPKTWNVTAETCSDTQYTNEIECLKKSCYDFAGNPMSGYQDEDDCLMSGIRWRSFQTWNNNLTLVPSTNTWNATNARSLNSLEYGGCKENSWDKDAPIVMIKTTNMNVKEYATLPNDWLFSTVSKQLKCSDPSYNIYECLCADVPSLLLSTCLSTNRKDEYFEWYAAKSKRCRDAYDGLKNNQNSNNYGEWRNVIRDCPGHKYKDNEKYITYEYSPDVKLKCFSDDRGWAAPVFRCKNTDCDRYDILVGTVNDIALFRYDDIQWKRMPSLKHWLDMLRKGMDYDRYSQTRRNSSSYASQLLHLQTMLYDIRKQSNYKSMDEQSDFYSKVLKGVLSYCDIPIDIPHPRDSDIFSDITPLFLYNTEMPYENTQGNTFHYGQIKEYNKTVKVRPTVFGSNTLINSQYGIKSAAHPRKHNQYRYSFNAGGRRGYLPDYWKDMEDEEDNERWLPTNFTSVGHMEDCVPSLVNIDDDDSIELFVACPTKIYYFDNWSQGTVYEHYKIKGKTTAEISWIQKQIERNHRIIDFTANECWQQTTPQTLANKMYNNSECLTDGVCLHAVSENPKRSMQSIDEQLAAYKASFAYLPNEEECERKIMDGLSLVWVPHGYTWSKIYWFDEVGECKNADGDIQNAYTDELSCISAGHCEMDKTYYNPSFYTTEADCDAAKDNLELEYSFEWVKNEARANRNPILGNNKELYSLNFFDIDNDGDKDMFLGFKDGDFIYIENGGLKTISDSQETCKWVGAKCIYNTDMREGSEVMEYNCKSCSQKEEWCSLEYLLHTPELIRSNGRSCRGRIDNCYSIGRHRSIGKERAGYCSNKRGGTNDPDKIITRWADVPLHPNQERYFNKKDEQAAVDAFMCRHEFNMYWIPFKFKSNGSIFKENKPEFKPGKCSCVDENGDPVTDDYETCINTYTNPKKEVIWNIVPNQHLESPSSPLGNILFRDGSQTTTFTDMNFGAGTTQTFDPEGGLYIGKPDGTIDYYYLHIADYDGTNRKYWEKWTPSSPVQNVFEFKNYKTNTCYEKDHDFKAFCNGVVYKNDDGKKTCCAAQQNGVAQYVHYGTTIDGNLNAKCCQQKPNTGQGDNTHCCPRKGERFNIITKRCECFADNFVQHPTLNTCCQLKTDPETSGDNFCCPAYGEIWDTTSQTCSCADSVGSIGNNCCQLKDNPAQKIEEPHCCQNIGFKYNTALASKCECSDPFKLDSAGNCKLVNPGIHLWHCAWESCNSFFSYWQGHVILMNNVFCPDYGKKSQNFGSPNSCVCDIKEEFRNVNDGSCCKIKSKSTLTGLPWDNFLPDRKFCCPEAGEFNIDPTGIECGCDAHAGFIKLTNDQCWACPQDTVVFKVENELILQDNYCYDVFGNLNGLNETECLKKRCYNSSGDEINKNNEQTCLEQKRCYEKNGIFNTLISGTETECFAARCYDSSDIEINNVNEQTCLEPKGCYNINDGTFFWPTNEKDCRSANKYIRIDSRFTAYPHNRWQDWQLRRTEWRSVNTWKTLGGQCYDFSNNPRSDNIDECLEKRCFNSDNNIINKNETECLEKHCYDSNNNIINKNETECPKIGKCYTPLGIILTPITNKQDCLNEWWEWKQTYTWRTDETRWDNYRWVNNEREFNSVNIWAHNNNTWEPLRENRNSFDQDDLSCRYMPETGPLANIPVVEAPIVCPDHQYLHGFTFIKRGDGLYYKSGGTCTDCPNDHENFRDINHWINGIPTPPVAAVHKTSCQKCPKDKYSSKAGQACTYCPAGTGRRHDSNTEGCSSCPTGKFNDGNGGATLSLTYGGIGGRGSTSIDELVTIWDDWHKSSDKRIYTWNDQPNTVDNDPMCMWCPDGKKPSDNKQTCCVASGITNFKTSGQSIQCPRGDTAFEGVNGGGSYKEDYIQICVNKTEIQGCPPGRFCYNNNCSDLERPFITTWRRELFNWTTKQSESDWDDDVDKKCRYCPRGRYTDTYKTDVSMTNVCKTCPVGKIAVRDSGCQDCPSDKPLTGPSSTHLFINTDFNAAGKGLPQASPRLAAMDYDFDGKMDIIVGTSDGLLRHFEYDDTTNRFEEVGYQSITVTSPWSDNMDGNKQILTLDNNLTLGLAAINSGVQIETLYNQDDDIPQNATRKTYFDIGDRASPTFVSIHTQIYLVVGALKHIYYFEPYTVGGYSDTYLGFKGDLISREFSEPIPTFADLNDDDCPDLIVAESTTTYGTPGSSRVRAHVTKHSEISVIYCNQTATTFADKFAGEKVELIIHNNDTTTWVPPYIQPRQFLYTPFLKSIISGIDAKEINAKMTLFVGAGNTVHSLEMAGNPNQCSDTQYTNKADCVQERCYVNLNETECLEKHCYDSNNNLIINNYDGTKMTQESCLGTQCYDSRGNRVNAGEPVCLEKWCVTYGGRVLRTVFDEEECLAGCSDNYPSSFPNRTLCESNNYTWVQKGFCYDVNGDAVNWMQNNKTECDNQGYTWRNFEWKSLNRMNSSKNAWENRSNWESTVNTCYDSQGNSVNINEQECIENRNAWQALRNTWRGNVWGTYFIHVDETRQARPWPDSPDCNSYTTKETCESVGQDVCSWWGSVNLCEELIYIPNNENIMQKLNINSDIYQCKDKPSSNCEDVTDDIKNDKCSGDWKLCMNENDCKIKNKGYTIEDTYQADMRNFNANCTVSCNTCPSMFCLSLKDSVTYCPTQLPGTWLKDRLNSVSPVIGDFDKDGFDDMLIGFNRPRVTTDLSHMGGIDIMYGNFNWESFLSDGNFKIFKGDAYGHFEEIVGTEPPTDPAKYRYNPHAASNNPMYGIDLTRYKMEYSTWKTCQKCPTGKFSNIGGLASEDYCKSCPLGTQLSFGESGITPNCVKCDFDTQYSEIKNGSSNCYDIVCASNQVLVEHKLCYNSSGVPLVDKNKQECLAEQYTWDRTWNTTTPEREQHYKCSSCEAGNFYNNRTCKQCPSGYFSELTTVAGEPELLGWGIHDYPALYGLSGQGSSTISNTDIQNKISEWNETGAVHVYTPEVKFYIGSKYNHTIQFEIGDLSSMGQWFDYEQDICVDAVGVEDPDPSRRSSTSYKEAVGFTTADCITGGSCIIPSKSLETPSHNSVWGCTDRTYTDSSTCEDNGRCFNYTTKLLCGNNHFSESHNSIGWCLDTSLTTEAACANQYGNNAWIQNKWEQGIAADIHTNNYKVACEAANFLWVDTSYYTGACIDSAETSQATCNGADRKWIPNEVRTLKTKIRTLWIERPGVPVQHSATECKQCPSSTPVSITGIDCVACQNGLGYIDGECSACPRGKYVENSQCIDCPPGRYYDSTEASSGWEHTCAGESYFFNHKCNFYPTTKKVGSVETGSTTYYLVTEGTCESAGYETITNAASCQTGAAQLNLDTSDDSWQTSEMNIPIGCVHNTLKTYQPVVGARVNPPPLLANSPITNCSETWRCICKRSDWKEEDVQDGFHCPSWDDCPKCVMSGNSKMFQYLNNSCNGETPWDTTITLPRCRFCPNGFYQLSSGQEECKQCPGNGKYVEATPPPLNTVCNDCAIGRFLTKNVPNGNDYICEDCGYARYQDSPAKTSCKRCPAGWQVTNPGDNITITSGILITEKSNDGSIDSLNEGDAYGDTGYIITGFTWNVNEPSQKIGVSAEKTETVLFNALNWTHVNAVKGSKECIQCPDGKYKSEDMAVCKTCYGDSVPTADKTDCYCGEAEGDEQEWFFELQYNKQGDSKKSCIKCNPDTMGGICHAGKAYCNAMYDHHGMCHDCRYGPVCVDNYAYCNTTNYDCIQEREPWEHPRGCVNDCKFYTHFDCGIYNTTACLACAINETFFKPPCDNATKRPAWLDDSMTEVEKEAASYLGMNQLTCLKECGAITYNCPVHNCTYEPGDSSNCCHRCESASYTTSSAEYKEFMKNGCDPQEAPWLRNCSDYQTETDCDAQDDICEWKEPDSTPWADSCASTCVRYRNKQFSAPYIDMEDSVCSCPYKMDECYHYCDAEWKTFIRNECDPDYAPDELKDLLNDACDNSVAVGQKWKPSWDGDASDYCVGDCDAADAQPTCYKWEFHIPAQPAVVGWYGSKCDNAGAVTKTVNGMTIGGLGECSSEATDLENGLIANPSGTWPPGDESVCTEVKSACEDASDCNWGNYNCYAQYIQTATLAYKPADMTASENFTEYCSRQNGRLIEKGVDGRDDDDHDFDQCWIPITLAEGQTCAGQNGTDLTNVINPANCVNINDNCYDDCEDKWKLWIETLDTYEFRHYSSGPTINGVQLSRYYQTRCKGNPKQGGWPPKDWHGAHEYGCPDHEKLKAENGVCPNKWEKPESWPGDRDDYCFANCPKCGSCGSCVPENHRCFMEQFDDKYPCTPAWQNWANNGCEGDPPWDETTNENTKYGCPRIEVSGSELAHPADKGRCEKPVPWAESCASSCEFNKMGCPYTNGPVGDWCWKSDCDANVAADKVYIDYINGQCAVTPPWDGNVVTNITYWPDPPVVEEAAAEEATAVTKTCHTKKLIYETAQLDIYKRHLPTFNFVEEFIPFYDVPLWKFQWNEHIIKTLNQTSNNNRRLQASTPPDCSQGYYLSNTTKRWQHGNCEWLDSNHVCVVNTFQYGVEASECFSGPNCNDLYYYEPLGSTKQYFKAVAGQCWPDDNQKCTFVADNIMYFDIYDPKYGQECVSMDCGLAESVYNHQCMEDNSAVICEDASTYFHQNCITCS